MTTDKCDYCGGWNTVGCGTCQQRRMRSGDAAQSFVQEAIAKEREQWTGPSNTDRELLELAGEAAGIDHLGFHADGLVYAHNWDCSDRYEWNPLTDDGDALRLAVKLDMEVWQAFGEARATANEHRNIFVVKHDSDRCAATRRAIVRAAAEIGKAVQS